MVQRFLISLIATAALITPLAAKNAAGFDQPQRAAAPSATRTGLSQFTPAADRGDHRLDWQHWDKALGWMVIPMGPSLRQGAARVDPTTGTRRIYGHESRLRLEGNRLAFSYLTPDIVTALGDYRADLERIGGELDLVRLPRNEQLAFWLNLHNVALIEALAKAYPLAEPNAAVFGPDNAPLDAAKLVKVAGIPLSLRDIREQIVYPNWRDPKVVYGFWRGEIGGPSIQRLAFTGDNVDDLLALSGEEFVNSLRGVEAWGGALRVSHIYEEASPFYFKDDAALRTHLSKFAGEDVARLLRDNDRIAFNIYETDIADLERGETDPNINERLVNDCKLNGCIGPNGGIFGSPPSISVNPAIARLMRERAEKLDRARRKGVRTGMVIYGNGEYAPGSPVREVD
ncbi:MAG: DUF547 domain-containing protein [Erythrobacter sp.]|nr:DUF547 domain-containing protein [Erythrobacter sp.]